MNCRRQFSKIAFYIGSLFTRKEQFDVVTFALKEYKVYSKLNVNWKKIAFMDYQYFLFENEAWVLSLEFNLVCFSIFKIKIKHILYRIIHFFFFSF